MNTTSFTISFTISLRSSQIGGCDMMTKHMPDVSNPCEQHHRIPKVFSMIFDHKGEAGNDVIM